MWFTGTVHGDSWGCAVSEPVWVFHVEEVGSLRVEVVGGGHGV